MRAIGEAAGIRHRIDTVVAVRQVLGGDRDPTFQHVLGRRFPEAGAEALGEPLGTHPAALREGRDADRPIKAPLAFDRQAYHAGGANRTQALRRGVLTLCIRSWLKPQTDHKRSAPRELIERASSQLSMPVTIVTGASSGLGALLVRRLVASGKTVAATARSADKLAALAKEDARIIPVAADVAEWEVAAATVERLERDHGPVEALINNAAVYHRRPFIAEKPAEVSRMLRTNVEGVMAWSLAVAPKMVARRAGRIVNVASVAGIRGIPEQAVYCASKHAVVGFGDTLSQELLPHGVAVSTICPGGIETPLWDGGAGYPGDRSKLMTAEEVAEAVEFLLTRPASSVYRRMILFPGNEWH